MKLLIIDAQGGGIGSRLIAGLRAAGIPSNWSVIAVGTNALATNAMLKSGADAGATGENAIVWNAARSDIILGPIGIVIANAMLGEITPAMASAVSGSDARKILIPSAKCSVQVAGVESRPVASYIDEAVRLVIGEVN